MNVKIIQDNLFDKPDNIIKVLINIGFREETIKYYSNRNFIAAARPEEGSDNPLGFMIYCNTCHYMYNTRKGNGDIISLVMDLKHVDFQGSLRVIGSILGISNEVVSVKKTTHPFPSLQKLLAKTKEYPELSVETYSENLLPPPGSLSFSYLKDGVSLKVQEKRGIRYDHDRDVIITPVYSLEGKLMGAKARSNNSKVSKEKRFYALLGYSKTLTLYGYCWNYKTIIQKQLVIIVEAEKSVLQAESFGCCVCVAVGGRSISDTQARYIRNLHVKNIIVAFDSDVLAVDSEYEAKKLVDDKTNVYYIHDSEERYMKKSDKLSPTDRGKNIFELITKQCRKRVQA